MMKVWWVMLEELHIQNYLLIDRLTVRFAEGLNVLSGETGAGKSILLGALTLLLGQRGGDVIRRGCDECVLSAGFRVGDDAVVQEWLNDHGVKSEEGRVVVRRIIRKSGRGAVHIQSAPATLAELSELAGRLVDIHGQHEHQSLLRTPAHRRMLDGYGGMLELTGEVGKCHAELVTLQKRFETLSSYQREHKHELELLEHAVQEIQAAHLESGEEQRLDEEIRVLSQYEQLHELCDELVRVLNGGGGRTGNSGGAGANGGIITMLARARVTLEQIGKIDHSLIKLSERLDTSYYELEDIATSAQEHLTGLRYDTASVQDKMRRRDLIGNLQQKYGDSIEKIEAYAAEAQAQIEQLRAWEKNRAAFVQNISRVQKQVMEAAGRLSEQRKQAATELAGKIVPIIRELGIGEGEFSIAVTQQRDDNGNFMCSASGIDIVEFLIRTNSGEEMRPLRKIASGGELSRIMLAMKSVLAAADRISTMIFDEIDSGIGGAVARAVGRYLQKLAEKKQVLCITHIASIAARASHHLHVSKEVRGDRTVTSIEEITGQERVSEIARMLAGKREGKSSIEHAEELLRECAQ